jgi:hypothetical protein
LEETGVTILRRIIVVLFIFVIRGIRFVYKDTGQQDSIRKLCAQVAALEHELGARLLTRTTRSLALTDEGERYFEQARRLVAEIAEAEAGLRRGEQ